MGIVLPIMMLAILGYEFYPSAVNAYLTLRLSVDASLFHDDLLYAREKSLTVEFDRRSWKIVDSDSVTKAGAMHDGVTIGTNFPGSKFWFDKSGACWSASGSCEEFQMAITSDARRVYTVFFDEYGVPVLGSDDF